MIDETIANALSLMCSMGKHTSAASSSDEMAAYVCANMGSGLGTGTMSAERSLLAEALWVVTHRGAALAALPHGVAAQLSLLAAAMMKSAVILSRTAPIPSPNPNNDKKKKTENSSSCNQNSVVIKSLLAVTAETLSQCSHLFGAMHSSALDGFVAAAEGAASTRLAPLNVMTECLLVLLSAVCQGQQEPLLLKTIADVYSCIGCIAADVAPRRKFELFAGRLLAPSLVALETAGPGDDSDTIIRVISQVLFAGDDDRALVELTSQSLADMQELLDAPCGAAAVPPDERKGKSRVPVSFYTNFYFVIRDTYANLMTKDGSADVFSGDCYGYVACSLYANFAAASLTLSQRPQPAGAVLEADAWQLRSAHRHCARLLHACFLVGQSLDNAAEMVGSGNGSSSSKKRKISSDSSSGCRQQLLRKRLLEALAAALHSSSASIPHHDSMTVYINALKRHAADSLAGVLQATSQELAAAHLDSLRVLGAIDHRTSTEADEGRGVLAALLAAAPLSSACDTALMDSCRALLLATLGLYQQLRRLDDFVACYSSASEVGGGAMVALLAEPVVFDEIVSALRTIPVGQVEDVWLRLGERGGRAQQLLSIAFCASRQGVSDSLAFAPLTVLQALLERAAVGVAPANAASALEPRVVEALLGLACSMLNRSYAVDEREQWSALLPPLEGLVSRLGGSPALISLTIAALKFATTYDVYFGSNSDGSAGPLLPLLEEQLLLAVQRVAEDGDAVTQSDVFCVLTRSFLVFESLLEGPLLPAFKSLLDAAITTYSSGGGGGKGVCKEVFLARAVVASALAEALLAAVGAASAALPCKSSSKTEDTSSPSLERLCYLLDELGDCLHETSDAVLAASLALAADIALSGAVSQSEEVAAARWRRCLCLLASYVSRARLVNYCGRQDVWQQVALASTSREAFSALLSACCQVPCAFPLQAGDPASALLAHLVVLLDVAIVTSVRTGGSPLSCGYIEVVVGACRDACGDASTGKSTGVVLFTLLRAVCSCACSLDARQLCEEGPAAMFAWVLDCKEGLVDSLLASVSGGSQGSVERRSLAVLLLAECLRLRVKLAAADSAPSVTLLLQADALLLSKDLKPAGSAAELAYEPEAWFYLSGVALLSSKALRRPLTAQGLSTLCRRMRESVLHRGCTGEGGSLRGAERWYEESSHVLLRALVECAPATSSDCLHALFADMALSSEQRLLRLAVAGSLALLECHRGRKEAVVAACRCLEQCSAVCGAGSLRHLSTAISRGLRALSHKQTRAATANTNDPNPNPDPDPTNAGGLSSFIASVTLMISGLSHRVAVLGGEEPAALLLLDLLGQLFSLQASLPLLNNSIGSLSQSLRQCVSFALADPAASQPDTAIAYGRSVSHCFKMLASSNNFSKHLYLFAVMAIDLLSLCSAPPPPLRDGLVSGIFALFERSPPGDRQRVHKLLSETGRSAYADVNITYMQDWKFVGRA